MQTEAQIDFREIAYKGAGYQDVLDLRQAALRTPLSLVLQETEKLEDEHDTIIGGYANGKLCCCLILRREDELMCRFRQIAVDESERMKGYGSSIVKHAEERARRIGFRKVYLKSRHDAVPFYHRLGFRVVGEQFIEVKLPHIRMEKDL